LPLITKQPSELADDGIVIVAQPQPERRKSHSSLSFLKIALSERIWTYVCEPEGNLSDRKAMEAVEE
jgi:hypothetical protein